MPGQRTTPPHPDDARLEFLSGSGPGLAAAPGQIHFAGASSASPDPGIGRRRLRRRDVASAAFEATDRPAIPPAPPVQIGRIEVVVAAPPVAPEPFLGISVLESGSSTPRGGGW